MKAWILPHLFVVTQSLSVAAEPAKCDRYATGNKRVLRAADVNGRPGSFRSIDKSEDGSSIFAEDRDGTKVILNLKTGKVFRATDDNSGDSTNSLKSPSGRYEIATTINGQVVLTDNKKGKQTILNSLRPQDGVASVRFAPDESGVAIMTATPFGAESILLQYNLKTGEEKRYQVGQKDGDFVFTGDSKKIITKMGFVVPSVTSSVSKIERELVCDDEGPYKLQESSDHRQLALYSQKSKNYCVFDLERGQKLLERLPGESEVLSPDFKKILASLPDREGIQITDLNNKWTTRKIKSSSRNSFDYWAKLPPNDVSGDSFFSKDSKYLIFRDRDQDRKIHIIDLDSGTSKSISKNTDVNSIGLSSDGASLLIATIGGVGEYNLKTGKEELIKRPPGWGYSYFLFSNESGAVYLLEKADDLSRLTVSTLGGEICVQSTYQVDLSTSSNCASNGSPIQDLALFEKIAAKLDSGRCSKPLDAGNWRGTEAAPKGRTLTRKQAEEYLLRFQKKGGFSAKTHLPVLLAILKSDIPEQLPDAVNGALQSVLAESNELYEDLISRFPKLLNLQQSFSTANTCRTEEERKYFRDKAKDYLDILETTNGPSSSLSGWRTLLPLAPVLADVPSDKKKFHIEKIAESLTQQAVGHERNNGISPSTLYYFNEQTAGKFFGKKPGSLTDFTLLRGGRSLVPVIVGSEPIGGHLSTDTDQGFYLKKLTPLKVENREGFRLQKTFEWTHDGKKFTHSVDIKRAEKSKLVTEASSPNYAKMWGKDNTLTGLVIGTSNYIPKKILTELREYYEEDEEFVFDHDPIPVDDPKQFLKERIASGEIDYLMKQAHTEGDSQNLLFLDNRWSVYRGQKEVEGKKEVIYLAFPRQDGGSSQTVPLPNHEFGAWMRDRARSPESGELLYIDGSCNSASTKAIKQIEAAQTPLFVEIPSTSFTYNFINSKGSGPYQLIHGIRSGKSYSQLADDLKNNVAQFESHSHYLLPGTPEYNEKVMKNLEIPLDIQETFVDTDGKPYNPGALIHERAEH